MATKEQVQSFFSRFKDVARDIQLLFGIPASVTLAQAAQETGYGLSGAATAYNAYFGVKKAGDAGTVQLISPEWDGEKMVNKYSEFGKYSSPEASFFAYGELIGSSDTYKDARKATNPAEWVNAIAAAGYATDPNYSTSVNSIISKYNLTQYDIKNDSPGSVIPDSFVDNIVGYVRDSQSMSREDFKKKYNIKTSADYGGTDDITVLNPSQVAEREAIKAAEEAAAQKLGFTGKIFRGAFIAILFIILIFIIIQALPIPQVQAVKALAKGATANG